jgi:hypothetical protein
VLELRRTGQLSKAAGLGRRRLGEIDAALVLSGFALADAASSGRRLDAGRPVPAKTAHVCIGEELTS